MQKVIVYFAFKIIDGVFLGNNRAPQEKDFLITNKIGYLINCAGSELPNFDDEKCLQFDWKDDDDQIIITKENVEKIMQFTKTAEDNGEGILFYSLRGQSRALTALIIFFMHKFSWSLYKTLQFLNARRKDFEIRSCFLNQLIKYQKEQFANITVSNDWKNLNLNTEEISIQNTYLNSLRTNPPFIFQTQKSLQSNHTLSKSVVSWAPNLFQYIQIFDQQSNNEQLITSKNPKSILKTNKKERKRNTQCRSVSVNECQQSTIDDIINFNVEKIKKLQTPTQKDINFDLQLRYQTPTPQRTISRSRVRRTNLLTPERQRIIKNTKQIMDTYLNNQIDQYQQLKLKCDVPSNKDKFRSRSHQSPSPALNILNNPIKCQLQFQKELNPVKKLPQFKIR